MSKGKVKVEVMSKYLISDLIFQCFHSYTKKSSKSSLKKGLLIYLSSIKTKLAINFLEETLHLANWMAGAERVKEKRGCGGEAPT